MSTIEELVRQSEEFINTVNQLEYNQKSKIETKEALVKQITELQHEIKDCRNEVALLSHAIEILNGISDDAVKEAYDFFETHLNTALERMFANTVRKIKLKEYTRGGQYPQLEFVLTVGNGKTRSLKSDSGHGLAQIVSLLSILSVIVITGCRRILILDEVLSGISKTNREIIDEILWTFTEIGFQFIINEHGFVPRNSNVYHLEMTGDVSRIKENYIEKRGIYLDAEKEEEEEEQEALNKAREVEGSAEVNKYSDGMAVEI